MESFSSIFWFKLLKISIFSLHNFHPAFTFARRRIFNIQIHVNLSVCLCFFSFNAHVCKWRKKLFVAFVCVCVCSRTPTTMEMEVIWQKRRMFHEKLYRSISGKYMRSMPQLEIFLICFSNHIFLTYFDIEPIKFFKAKARHFKEELFLFCPIPLPQEGEF